MNASTMMARMTTTQKKNTTMLGMACPATVLARATATVYPPSAYSAGVRVCRRGDRRSADRRDGFHRGRGAGTERDAAAAAEKEAAYYVQIQSQEEVGPNT
jgi:hypothetical protein